MFILYSKCNFKSVYETNERISIFGEYLHGFISLVFVGALNVGTIDLNFDKVLFPLPVF